MKMYYLGFLAMFLLLGGAISFDRLPESSNEELIRAEYEEIVAGFRESDYTAYYAAMDDDAVVIDANSGRDFEGIEEIETYFEMVLEEVVVGFPDWKIRTIDIANDVAFVDAEYVATFTSKSEVINSHSNWRMIWKKDERGDWKIVMEIYYEMGD